MIRDNLLLCLIIILWPMFSALFHILVVIDGVLFCVHSLSIGSFVSQSVCLFNNNSKLR